MDAADWDARYAADPTLWGAGPNRFVAERLAAAEPGRALDLGCGNGRNAVWLARRGWRVTGVDISAVALDQARARCDQAGVEVEWVCADAASWSPPGPVELVLATYLQLPVAELVAALSRAAGWLTPDGRLVYLGHARVNLDRGAGGPSEAAVLPEVADLVAAADGLRTHSLGHLLRDTDAGTAIDVILDVSPWSVPTGPAPGPRTGPAPGPVPGPAAGACDPGHRRSR